MLRTDAASRTVHVSPEAVWEAFATPAAMERWLPPAGMTGEMLAFDFRPGGGYRLRLTYGAADHGAGKTSADADEVAVQLVALEPHRSIVQTVWFESERPEFAGLMRMTWTFEPVPEGTLVAIRCTNVPPGIGEKDHAAGLASSLHNLAAFVEGSGEAAAAPLISPSPPPPLRPGPPDRPTCRSP